LSDDNAHWQGHPASPGAAPNAEGPRVALPPADQALRGVALGGLGALLAMISIGLVRRVGPLASPIAAVGGVGSFLAAWAALIHLTGGERFDDHPFL